MDFKSNKTKATITIAPDLLEKIDEAAKKLYLTRSAYISVAVAQKLQADNAMAMMPQFQASIDECTKTIQEALEKSGESKPEKEGKPTA